MRFRSSGRDDLERLLREAVSEPREEFVRSVARRMRAQRGDGRLWALSRLSFAGAVTVLIFGSVASFGGLGYAATSAGQAADAVEDVLVPKKQDATVVQNSPAQRGHVEPLETEQIEVAAATKRRQQPPPPLQLAVPQQQGELAFTGLALTTTFALALMLIAFGAFLRRVARTRARA
jgi:hypothetical protein